MLLALRQVPLRKKHISHLPWLSLDMIFAFLRGVLRADYEPRPALCSAAMRTNAVITTGTVAPRPS